MTGKTMAMLLLAVPPWTMGGAARAVPFGPPADAATSTDAGVVAVNRRIDQRLGDHAKYEPVIRAFQQAVAAKDAAAVAALTAYPLAVKLGGQTVKIRDAKEFAARYASIVTPVVAAAITKQRYGALFVNCQA